MGASLFLILFVLGILLSTVGGIIGLVEAFRVNTTWGVLSLLVPFALLVFFIKFFRERKWTRNGFFIWLAGILSTLLAFPVLVGFIRDIAGLDNVDTAVEEFPIEPIPTEEGAVVEPIEGEEAPTDEEFVEPIVPAAPQLSAIASAELIQSTDPEERLQQVTSSRPDPFATVPVPPAPSPAPPPAPGGGATAPGGGTPTATAPQLPGPGGQGAAPQPGGTGQPGGAAGQPGGGATGPGGGVELPPIEPLPALPEPSLAQGTVVTGVVRIGNENFAIVQSPTDGTSQYVRAGQRLANGQVLVKRIEVQGSTPVVILEQNGIEVAQPVGGSVPEEGQEAPQETAARLPNLPPTI
jgi:hypothetical protein